MFQPYLWQVLLECFLAVKKHTRSITESYFCSCRIRCSTVEETSKNKSIFAFYSPIMAKLLFSYVVRNVSYQKKKNQFLCNSSVYETFHLFKTAYSHRLIMCKFFPLPGSSMNLPPALAFLPLCSTLGEGDTPHFYSMKEIFFFSNIPYFFA